MNQENQPEVNQSTNLPAEVGEPVIQKPNNFLVILLSILLLISCVIAGFFAYQTQKLVNELRVMSEELKQTPTPIASVEPTADPTADLSRTESKDWKTYIDSKFNFSFEYPNSGSVVELSQRDFLLGGASFVLKYDDNAFRPQASAIFIHLYDANNLSLEDWLKNNSTDKPFGSEPQKEFYEYSNLGKSLLLGISSIEFQHNIMGFIVKNVAIKKGGYVYIFGHIKVLEDLSEIYNQILSTFKFTN